MARGAFGATCVLWTGLALFAGACGDDGGDGGSGPDSGAGTGGSSGSASGGSAGVGGSVGVGGSSGSGGSSGVGGSVGVGGSAGSGVDGSAGSAPDGSAGSGGSAGSAGQGGSSGSGVDAGPPLDCTPFANVTPSVACTSYADAYCTLLDTCSPASWKLLFSSLAQCKERLELQCTRELTAPLSGANPAMMAAGADAIGKLTCAEFQATLFDSIGEPGPGCGNPGTLAVGKQCYANTQCASGDCLENNPCGTCTGVGSACDSTSDCLDDAFCNALDKCELKKSTGQPCAEHEQCAESAWCASTCQPDKALGATCADDEECARPLICGANKQCKAPSLAALGAACTPGETQSCNNNFMLTCDATTQSCVLDPWPGPGDPCGLLQQGGMPVFKPFCGSNSTCIFNAGLTGFCVANAPDGASCNETNGPFCTFLGHCVNGTCVVPDAALCPPN